MTPTTDRRAQAVVAFHASPGTPEQRLHAALDAYDTADDPGPSRVTDAVAEHAARQLAAAADHPRISGELWRDLLTATRWVEFAFQHAAARGNGDRDRLAALRGLLITWHTQQCHLPGGG